MSNRIFSTIFICFYFVAVHAQCDDLLRSARSYKDKGEYGKAVDYYNDLEKQCPNYITEKVKGERKTCKEKLESQNKTNQQRASNSRVRVSQAQTSGFISGSSIWFPAEGDSICETRVSCSNWFVANYNIPDWLVVEERGSCLYLRCSTNSNTKKRNYTIDIVCNGGAEIGKVYIEQEEGGASSKHTPKTSPTEQTEEVQPVTVRVTFDAKKANPNFDNPGKLLGLLADNENYSLQIEMPWCNKLYNARLIEKRVNSIKDYFIHSGIPKDRISVKMIYDDVEKADSSCDCATAKTILNQ